MLMEMVSQNMPEITKNPQRIIKSRVPIRICDNGGWTDTWFAGHGTVFNIAVQPGMEVELNSFPRAGKRYRAVIHSDHIGDLYLPGTEAVKDNRFQLVEAIVNHAAIPENVSLEITIRSGIPPGSATGSSAAVAVALLGALEHLHGRPIVKRAIAYKAHDVETRLLGQQSGIQDQLCCAYGGINFIEMTEYPLADVHQLAPPAAIISELENRLVLICLGGAHDSSSLHEKVIKKLESAGPECEQLKVLRQAAIDSRDALLAGDFEKLGLAMKKNTASQERLHPDLISLAARQIISIAEKHGAQGWKVNGAGGNGGSLTILSGSAGKLALNMIREIESAVTEARNIPLVLDQEGLTVWDSTL
jgi:D-glycero-alpha-D-manno-heptose-7-phosphate kinase